MAFAKVPCGRTSEDELDIREAKESEDELYIREAKELQLRNNIKRLQITFNQLDKRIRELKKEEIDRKKFLETIENQTRIKAEGSKRAGKEYKEALEQSKIYENKIQELVEKLLEKKNSVDKLTKKEKSLQESIKSTHEQMKNKSDQYDKIKEQVTKANKDLTILKIKQTAFVSKTKKN